MKVVDCDVLRLSASSSRWLAPAVDRGNYVRRPWRKTGDPQASSSHLHLLTSRLLYAVQIKVAANSTVVEAKVGALSRDNILVYNSSGMEKYAMRMVRDLTG